jgi:hypothetical protein
MADQVRAHDLQRRLLLADQQAEHLASGTMEILNQAESRVHTAEEVVHHHAVEAIQMHQHAVFTAAAAQEAVAMAESSEVNRAEARDHLGRCLSELMSLKMLDLDCQRNGGSSRASASRNAMRER